MAFDAFLYFSEKVTGETTDSVYKAKGGIGIYSFSWGLANPTSVGHGTGLSAGKVSLSSMNVMKRVDSSSSDLAMMCATGTTIKEATLVCRKASGTDPLEYLTYVFKDVMVESLQISGSAGGDDYPTESLSFAYASVHISYVPQETDGTKGKTKEFKWNVTTNKSEG